MGRHKTDITGQRFGRLTAVSATSDRWKKYVIWECRCDCGMTVYAPYKRLIEGMIKSCGCLMSDKRKELGLKMYENSKSSYVENTNLRNLNSKAPRNNTSGRKGVSWSGRDQKWEAYITISKKRIGLGYFDDFDKAVQAREEAEEKYFNPILEKYRSKEGT